MPFWSRRQPTVIAPDAPETLFDSLEPRLVLYTDPFLTSLPSTDMMEDGRNTVVRMQTSAGNVDIEMYDIAGPDSASPAPNTVTNFLNYIAQGRYDGTFFHRFARNPNTQAPFVLQGGGFSLIDPLPNTTPRFFSVVTNGQINNEFDSGRSNIERTLAMAKLGNQPDSATSQFFFNLGDNSANLNNQNGGFTVFAHVIQGWDIIQNIISSATIRDLNSYLGGSAFNEVPISDSSNNASVFSIKDIEIIKPKNATTFYTQAAYFPEGFRSPRSSDAIDMVNSDPNAGVVYQIIARFETGQRDKVVAQGFLIAGGHISIPIYKGGDNTLQLVRFDTPLGYEIRSSKPVGASIRHSDFGAFSGEAFVAVGSYAATELESWTFANGQKGPGLASFLEWINAADQTNTITATFYAADGTSFAISQNLQPFRRGGLDVNQLSSVPNGLYSVTITSSLPIVAALSQYRIAPARGSLETGVLNGGASRGVLPGAEIPASGQSILSAVYAGASAAAVIIDLDFVLSDGTVLTAPGAITLSSNNRRRDVDVSTLNAGLPQGQFFTIRYRVRNDSAAVTLGYTSIANGDAVSTSFQTASTTTVFFGDGFTNPATAGTETISIYNPFNDPTVVMHYRIKFNFANGASSTIVFPAGGGGDLAGGHRLDVTTRSLTEVMQQIQAGGRFQHYSITIEASFTGNSLGDEGVVFAQLTRFDGIGGTITSGPTTDGSRPVVFANDPRFG